MSFKKSDQLKAFDTAFKKDFSKGLKHREPQWPKIAMKIKSSTKTNTYGFLSAFPTMKKWVGKRIRKKMQAQAMTVENDLFESTVEVPRTDIEDDQVGMYSIMMEQAGQSAAELPDDLVFGILPKGKETVAYDGAKFFDARHPYYPNVDGTGKAKYQSNLTTGEVESALPFYIVDDSNVAKPLIWQERSPAELETKFDPNKSDIVFMEDMYLWGARARGNAGFAFWQLAHMVEKTELTADVIKQVIASMKTLKGDGSKRLKIRPTTIWVPAELEFKAKELLESEKINGSNNVLYKALEVKVLPQVEIEE